MSEHVVKLFLAFVFVPVLFFSFHSQVNAATYYWVGGTTNSNTNNPANWNTVQGSCADSGNVTVPSTTDSLQFVSNCTNNATVNATLSVATLVMNLGYTGTVNVNGNSLTVSTTLTVNNGNLNISNGGTVTSPSGVSNFVIGNVSSSNGTVTVSGSGSQLLQTNVGDTRVRLGNASGAVGNLIIQNGASATTGNINAGYAAGGTGYITVDGAGSVWNSDITGGLGYIGRQGTATLTISNGGVVNSAAIPWQVGGLAGAIGTVDISGTGSQLNMTGSTCNFRLGFSGTGTVTVSNGATVNVSGTGGKITVADQTGSSGTLNIGSGYTMDQVTTTLGIFTGVGTASLPPNPPSNLTNTAVTQTSISWDWDDVTTATGYKVYNNSNSLLTTISSATSNWVQTPLSLFTSTSVKVRSTNAQGVGYASASVSARTLGELQNPIVTLSNSTEGRENNLLRLKGTVSARSPYTISSVQYSVNGGSFSNATATDGSFEETNEDYYVDFAPTSNQPKDSNENLIDGYTVRVKAVDSNTSVTDRVFFFSPFNLEGPSDNSTLTTSYPTFEFSVNKQRLIMQDSVQKYQIMVKRGGSGSASQWSALVDEIPVDFRSVKNDQANKQKDTFGHLDTNNGVYETDSFSATYSEESSRIKVYSKINALSGTYQWKVVALDKSGHAQETGTRNLLVTTSGGAMSTTANNFPLAILNISGLGNPHLNSFSFTSAKKIYSTTSLNPVFYGIAWSTSNVTLRLTMQGCTTDCTKTYSTTANTSSRFGINVSRGDLKLGKKYDANLSVSFEEKWNELPQFTLAIGSGL